jgi:hypothetical protein
MGYSSVSVKVGSNITDQKDKSLPLATQILSILLLMS